MRNRFFINRGAGLILAKVSDLAVDFGEGFLANGAVFGEFDWLFVAGAKVGEDFEDFGDDVAGFVNDDAVADAEVFALDLVFVVKSGAGNGRAIDEGWFEDGDGCDGAGAADLEEDIEDAAGDFLGGEFVSDGVARGFGGLPHLGLGFEVVDFDDDAVDVIRQFLAFFNPTMAMGDDLFDVGEFFGVGFGRKAEVVEGF